MRNRNVEKSKNFKQSIKKLFNYIKPYTFAMIISVILIIISTIFTLVGPNKLSDITNIVQKGLSINIDLNAEQYAELKTNGTYTLETDTVTIHYDIVDEELSIYVENITINDTLIPMFPVGSVNMTALEEEKYINFDGKNLGVGLNDGALQLWINTETKIDIEAIFKIGIELIVIYLIAYVVNFAQGFIMATINQKVSRTLRSDISNKINKLPLKYFDSTTYGDVLSRVTNDVDTIGMTLNNSVSTLIGAGALFIGSLIMMFVNNWIMALSGIAATLIGFGLMIFIITKSQKYFIKQQKVLGQVNGLVEEIYSGQEIIKAYNAEQETKTAFDKANGELYTTAWKSQFLSGLMQPLMSFIGNFGYVVVCVVGAVLVFYGKIGFPVIIAIMIYIRLFTQPLAQLAQGASNLQSTAAASERVFELLESPELTPESDKTRKLTNIVGNVEFRNVRFGYTSDKIIIKDFSAKIKAGQKVAIVGPTGAGKTTLVNLLMRFYELNGGDILIDGVSTSELTRENIHDIFGMVLQDTWLFEGTIKENIRYNRTDITDDRIEDACKKCGIDHFIHTLPNGYDTILDDNTNISAGQKQLLTIARAMVENAPMLILDEATSSVDTRTEILIQNAMDSLTKNRTSFVIAHRLSTIKNADMILVMRDGDIVESGNHDELLAKNGFYAELYNSQFEEVE